MKRWLFLLSIVTFALGPMSPLSHAQEGSGEPVPATGTESPIHNELRALLKGMSTAIDKWELDELITYLHPNVVVTWPDATVSKGPEAVKAYLVGKTSGPTKIVETFKTTISVDDLTKLYANDTVGIAYGKSLDRFGLASGNEMTVNERWSATMVKEGGRWLVASIQTSADLFDNPLVTAAKKMAIILTVIGTAIGLLVGYLLARWIMKPRVI